MAQRAPLYELRASAIQGWGLFAVRRIRRGTLIIEYTGERITAAEADARYDDDAMERHHTFLFSVNTGTVIDGGVAGNESRFINHSCEPNCFAYVSEGRIFIEALRTIQAGEELTYDYAYERAGRYRAEWKERYACHCGAPTCRGTILKHRAPQRKRSKR